MPALKWPDLGLQVTKFILFRTLLGLYLFFFFLRLVLSDTEVLFPSNNQVLVLTILIIGMISSGLIAHGRMILLAGSMGLACMQATYSLSPLTQNIGPGYYGFAVLVLMALSDYMPVGWKDFQPDSERENLLGLGRWVLSMTLGASYFYSAMSKLASAPWRSGEAMGLISTDLLFVSDLSWVLLDHPKLSLLVTWGVMAVETAYLPAILLNRNLGRLTHLLISAMYVGIFIFMKFKFMILGVLLVHLFAWNAERRSFRSFVDPTR